MPELSRLSLSSSPQRHAQALSELEARWANLRSGPRQLAERQLTQEAHALASVCYERIVTHFADNLSKQTFWRTDLADTLKVVALSAGTIVSGISSP